MTGAEILRRLRESHEDRVVRWRIVTPPGTVLGDGTVTSREGEMVDRMLDVEALKAVERHGVHLEVLDPAGRWVRVETADAAD